MGRTEAYPILTPKRPTANLISKKVLTSLLGQIGIQSLFQGLLFIIIRRQPWYTPPKYDSEEKNIECYENTVLFLLSCFQYLLVAIVFSVGPPFRKPMSSNRMFFCYLSLFVYLFVYLNPFLSVCELNELFSSFYVLTVY
jgi:cation-transporting ATPase 13A3/4/5